MDRQRKLQHELELERSNSVGIVKKQQQEQNAQVGMIARQRQRQQEVDMLAHELI
jgi:hypothetical protein